MTGSRPPRTPPTAPASFGLVKQLSKRLSKKGTNKINPRRVVEAEVERISAQELALFFNTTQVLLSSSRPIRSSYATRDLMTGWCILVVRRALYTHKNWSVHRYLRARSLIQHHPGEKVTSGGTSRMSTNVSGCLYWAHAVLIFFAIQSDHTKSGVKRRITITGGRM